MFRLEKLRKASIAKGDKIMSKKYSECPLYNHDNCKDFCNPRLCAVVREDKICIKKTKDTEGGK